MDELITRINTIYAMHGHTVFEIVERLWLRIQDSPQKADVLQRFVDEVEDGREKCTNGFMVRMANVFVGYDDAFVMKLSAKEILQARIPATIAREQKVGGGSAVDVCFRILKQTWDDICEVDIMSMSEKQAWLEPLLDELLEAGFAGEIVAIPTFCCNAFAETNTSEETVEQCGVCMRCFLNTRVTSITGDLATIVATYCYAHRCSGSKS